MSNRASDSDSFGERLPPRPEPQTGEPFPPPGLSYFGSADTRVEGDPYRESRLSRRPEPPPEHGPILAWHRENRKGKIRDVLVAAALMVVGTAVISLLDGSGLSALTMWPVWSIIVVFTILMAGPFSYMTCSAGADWLQVDRVRWGKHKRIWVDLYGLKRIHAHYGGSTFHLELHDTDVGLARSFQELQQDRRIWDLVYNGILHSVADGATVSQQAIGILQLNKTPALQLREKSG